MAEIRYGQLDSWDDVSCDSQSDFMKLEEGENCVRVLTTPFQFIVHWVKDATGVNRKIRCAVERCPLCKKGDKPQQRWYVGVIERRSGQAKILEISQQIMKGIKNYVHNPKWGDCKNYDLNIKRGPKNSQPLYSVMVEPKEPLSDEDKRIRAEFKERVDISKFTQPSTPEEVLEKMGNSIGDDEPRQTRVAQSSKPAQKPAPKAPVVDDDDFNFDDDE